MASHERSLLSKDGARVAIQPGWDFGPPRKKTSDAVMVTPRIRAITRREIVAEIGKWSLTIIFVPTKITIAARP
jgi:hypothetical protein